MKPPKNEADEFPLKNDSSRYGVVTKKLGNARFLIQPAFETREIIGRLCGKFKYRGNKKKYEVSVGSLVLIASRDYEEKTVDIIYVYNHEQARVLRKNKEVVELESSNFITSIEDDVVFDFDDI